jgi:hypothetical protein
MGLVKNLFASVSGLALFGAAGSMHAAAPATINLWVKGLTPGDDCAKVYVKFESASVAGTGGSGAGKVDAHGFCDITLKTPFIKEAATGRLYLKRGNGAWTFFKDETVRPGAMVKENVDSSLYLKSQY